MAIATNKTCCVVCSKERATLRCAGCLQEFYFNHLGDHRQELNKQLDEIEVNRDLFRQSLTQQIQQPNNHQLIQQINQWEQKSFEIIRQTAEKARRVILKSTNECAHQLEIKLNTLTQQLRYSRQENDFNEINLRQFQEELERLTNELSKPSNVSIREDATSFISKISVHVSDNYVKFVPKASILPSNLHHSTRWRQNGCTVAGGNGGGKGLNQLSSPIDIYVNEDQTIYIADAANHRIVEWKYGATNGQVVAGGNGVGNGMNQLNWPIDVIIDKDRNHLIICDRTNRRVVQWSRRNSTRGQTIISNIDCSRLAMDTNGYLYVSDDEKDEVRRWKVGDTSGILVAGGNGHGNSLNQLNRPSNIFVDEDRSVYISDWGNHRVMKWMEGAKEGVIVAGGQGKGNNLTQLSYPQGLIVDHLGTVYVADPDNHRIVRWPKGATQGNIVVGGNDHGGKANQLSSPYGLSIDRKGNLYVVDSDNHRVQRFDIDCS